MILMFQRLSVLVMFVYKPTWKCTYDLEESNISRCSL